MPVQPKTSSVSVLEYSSPNSVLIRACVENSFSTEKLNEMSSPFSYKNRLQLETANDKAQLHKHDTLRGNFTNFLTSFSLPCYHLLMETRITSYER